METARAKAILIANLKGAKKKRYSLVIVAEATRVLLKEYTSSKTLADHFAVSRPIIESFDKINDQPEEIKSLIDEGKIGLDTSTKLSTIKDLGKRIEMARTVASLTAFDARYIIDYSKKHPEVSAQDSKKAVMNSKTNEIHVLVVPLEAQEFNEFALASKINDLKLEEAARVAILEWLGKHKQEGKP